MTAYRFQLSTLVLIEVHRTQRKYQGNLDTQEVWPFIENKRFRRVVKKIARDSLIRQRESDCIVDVNDGSKWKIDPFTAARIWYKYQSRFQAIRSSFSSSFCQVCVKFLCAMKIQKLLFLLAFV